MPAIGAGCHELRIQDAQQSWRVVYRIDEDAIVVIEVFSKKTGRTPKSVIDRCKQRLKDYDSEESQARTTRG
jgi:phage-related protein